MITPETMLIVAGAAFLLFGGKKLPELGRSLGHGVVPQDSVERLGGGCKRSGTYSELACPPTGLKRSGDGGKAVLISIQPCRASDDRRS